MEYSVNHSKMEDTKDMQKAGTGFMLMPTEAMKHLENKGYDKNLSLKFDHFEVDSGQEKIYPQDFEIDEVVRFENASDPDDQSILYAISSPPHGLKGLYLESYGVYQDDISKDMVKKLKEAHMH